MEKSIEEVAIKNILDRLKEDAQIGKELVRRLPIMMRKKQKNIEDCFEDLDTLKKYTKSIKNDKQS